MATYINKWMATDTFSNYCTDLFNIEAPKETLDDIIRKASEQSLSAADEEEFFKQIDALLDFNMDLDPSSPPTLTKPPVLSEPITPTKIDNPPSTPNKPVTLQAIRVSMTDKPINITVTGLSASLPPKTNFPPTPPPTTDDHLDALEAANRARQIADFIERQRQDEEKRRMQQQEELKREGARVSRYRTSNNVNSRPRTSSSDSKSAQENWVQSKFIELKQSVKTLSEYKEAINKSCQTVNRALEILAQNNNTEIVHKMNHRIQQEQESVDEQYKQVKAICSAAVQTSKDLTGKDLDKTEDGQKIQQIIDALLESSKELQSMVSKLREMIAE